MAEAFPDVSLHAIPSVLPRMIINCRGFLHGVRQGARDAEQQARDSSTSYQHTPSSLGLRSSLRRPWASRHLAVVIHGYSEGEAEE